jgi:hypothetical protein
MLSSQSKKSIVFEDADERMALLKIQAQIHTKLSNSRASPIKKISTEPKNPFNQGFSTGNEN